MTLHRTHPLLAVALAGSLLLSGCSGATAVRSAPSAGPVQTSPSPTGATMQPALDRLEQQYDARLGVAVITGDGTRIDHRGDERFAFASTGKVFIAAALLRSATDAELAEVVHYSSDDLLDYAPVTEQHVDDGMTVRALIDAALRYSDNTAANLLVERLGGPAAVERFLRSIGDRTTSVDRTEPDLNTAVPGDRRDTTTPDAYAADLHEVLLGDALPEPRRALLEQLMRANTTGGPYIRAGVPDGWTVEDKTGAGSYGVRNDIAVVQPRTGSPVVLVLLSSRSAQDADSQDKMLADATEVVTSALD